VIGEPAAAKKTKKITICLDGQTKTVKKKKWQARYSGATKGECSGSPVSPPVSPPAICKNQGEVCTPSASTCCGPLRCGHHLNDVSGDKCCLDQNQPCTTQTELQCCSGVCSTATTGKCFCKDPGMDCNSNSQCCSNNCLNQKCT
jgi:hypothetical protein